jgi:hypothetical protein
MLYQAAQRTYDDRGAPKALILINKQTMSLIHDDMKMDDNDNCSCGNNATINNEEDKSRSKKLLFGIPYHKILHSIN